MKVNSWYHHDNEYDFLFASEVVQDDNGDLHIVFDHQHLELLRDLLAETLEAKEGEEVEPASEIIQRP